VAPEKATRRDIAAVRSLPVAILGIAFTVAGFPCAPPWHAERPDMHGSPSAVRKAQPTTQRRLLARSLLSGRDVLGLGVIRADRGLSGVPGACLVVGTEIGIRKADVASAAQPAGMPCSSRSALSPRPTSGIWSRHRVAGQPGSHPILSSAMDER